MVTVDMHAQLRTRLDNIPQLQQVESVTKIPKEIFAVALSLVLLVVVLLGIGHGSVTNILCFLYPAFKSFEAIEHHYRSEVTHWLTYWVVYSFLAILEVFSDTLQYWIPFYYAFKLAFLLWAMLPQTRGAAYLYDSFLKDFLKKNDTKIDSALKDAKVSAGKVVSEAAAVTEGLDKSAHGQKDE